MANEFVPFAFDPSANVVSQPNWVAHPDRARGFQAGIADSASFNKAWRQATTMASALGTFIDERVSGNVVDDGNVGALTAQLAAAINATAGSPGATGATGQTGPGGPAATIQVGATVTGTPGSQAMVVNHGTTTHAMLHFTIPQGLQGPAGGGGGATGGIEEAPNDGRLYGRMSQTWSAVADVVLDGGSW